MAFTKNHRTPVQLTAAARAAFRAFIEPYLSSGLFPVDAVHDINFVLDVVVSNLPSAANYRSFDTESDVGDVPAGQTKGGKIPPISRRLHVDEYQQLVMYQADSAQIGAVFEKYAVRIAQAIASRIILAQYQALVTGKVTIAERNLSFDIDFGRNANLTATAAVPWSTIATSAPVGDLEALRAVYGMPLDRVLVSQQAMTYLQTSTDMIKLALQRSADLPSRISVADVQSVFNDYNVGQLTVSKDRITNQAGVLTDVIPSDKVVIVPSGQIGRTVTGVTAESIEADNGIGMSDQAGLFAGAMQQDDPSGYNVLVSGVVLPLLEAPNSTAVLDAF